MISGLAAHLWQSTLCAAAAWLLAVALRRHRAQVRYLVWWLASVKFLIPFSLLVGLGASVPWRAAAPLSERGWVAVAKHVRPLVTIPDLGAEVTVAANQAGQTYALAALGLWFCGFGAIAICWVTRWRRIEEIRRRATLWRTVGIAPGVRIMSAPGLLEPGVFGVFRPVLLLPAGITERLTQPQLEAVLAHELCHIRRRDNLTAAIHMAVQSIFWFHPLVWWLGTRLVDERERACDEEVVRLGNEPQVYAEGILTVCKLYLESPLACMAGVTGSDLKRRIETIMKNPFRRELGFASKFALALAGLVAVSGPLTVGIMGAPALQGQAGKIAPAGAAASLPSFEVASIKPSDPDGQLKVDFAPGGRLFISHATVRFLMKIAYDVGDDQISGGPAWLGSKRFDVEGKPDTQIPGDPAKMTKDQLVLFHEPTRLRLQRLLAERFHLELRRESKPMPVFALTIGKNGTKMGRDTSSGDPIMKGNTGGGVLEATRVDMDTLARYLSEGQTGRPVVNMTGLNGGFDFRLEWTPDASLNPQNDSSGPPAADPGGISIFTALQQELGLKLEARTGSALALAVTSVEFPSAN